MSSLPPTPVPLSYASAGKNAFRSIRRVCKTLSILLWANVAASLLVVLFSSWQLQLLRAAQANVYPSPAEAALNDSRIAVASGVSIMLMMATGVVFLVWVYRATANLRCFSSRELRLSPGAAVAWFFCPLVNLVRIPQAIRQIYNRSSHPELPETTMPAIIGWWWAFWILAGVAQRVATGMMYSNASLSELVGATWVQIVSEGIYLVAALCAITFVRRINRMQQDRPVTLECGA